MPNEQRRLVSVEDYLASEFVSPVKHEYVEGRIYRRPYEINLHNMIGGNTLACVGFRLRGKRCRVWNSDTKIRLRLASGVRFYYPDTFVVARGNPPDDSFQDEPAVIFEVLSRKTRRIDQVEKKDAYLTIPSLGVYVLIEQDNARVVAHRRTDFGFQFEVYEGLNAVMPLAEIEIELPLAEIYEGVEFEPEPDVVTE